MEKVISFKTTIEDKLQRAEGLAEEEFYGDALSLLFAALREDRNNLEVKLRIAEIYAHMRQLSESLEYYFSALSNGLDDTILKTILAFLLSMGELRLAYFYAERFGITLSIDDSVIVDENGEIIEEDYDEDEGLSRGFRLVVNKRTKDGENLAAAQPDEDVPVDDEDQLESMTPEEFIEQITLLADATHDRHSHTTGFRQVYPLTKNACEDILEYAGKLYAEGDFDEALNYTKDIDERYGRYFYLAQKQRTMCWLMLGRYVKMKEAAESALKGLPDDLAVNCYYYLALKCLKEDAAATVQFEKFRNIKPTDSSECMVKLNACRIEGDHKGVLDCADRILEWAPFNRQFLMCKGKAEYNMGKIREAKMTFIYTLRLFPDCGEAKLLLKRIGAGAAGEISYSSSALVAIEREKLKKECREKLTDYLDRGIEEGKRLLSNDSALLEQIELILLDDSSLEEIVFFIDRTGRLFSAEVEDFYCRLLLKNAATQQLKWNIIVQYLLVARPEKLMVSLDNKLAYVEMPHYIWASRLPVMVEVAAYMTIADFMCDEQPLYPSQRTPQRNVQSLAARLARTGEYIRRKGADNVLVQEFEKIDNEQAMRKLLYDLTLGKKKKKRAINMLDEAYFRYLALMEKIKDDDKI